MKKIRISENELIDLIEKLVKENIGNGTGFNFGMLGTPTSKYKELEETQSHGEFDTDNVEGGEDEEVDEEFNYDTSQTGDKTVDLNVMKQTNQTDWMGESKITESQLINRLSKKLHEDEGRAMQDMTKDIERRGTEGSFRKWCQSKNKSWDGCSPECWDAAMATNDKSLHRKVSGAKFYCD